MVRRIKSIKVYKIKGKEKKIWAAGIRMTAQGHKIQREKFG